MSVELKIKSKHLALEPKIIKREEKKIGRHISWLFHQGHTYPYSSERDPGAKLGQAISKLSSLHLHRVNDVRNEARATELARAYLAGKAYRSVEPKTKEDFDSRWKFTNHILPRVLTMVQKYGTKEQKKLTIEDIKAWTQVIPNS